MVDSSPCFTRIWENIFYFFQASDSRKSQDMLGVPIRDGFTTNQPKSSNRRNLWGVSMIFKGR